MKLEGTYTFKAPQQVVWEEFIRPATLQHCLPGCQKLDPQGAGTFAAVMKIGIGPVNGIYTGSVRLFDEVPPQQYRLGVEGGGGPGVIRGEGLFTFQDDPTGSGSTVVTYAGDVHVAGTIAAVGQRVFTAAAKMVIGQFMRCMEERIAAASAS